MIELKQITIKNFMSIGAVTQVVDLTHDHLTLVLGENLDLGGEDAGQRNAVGKSSIINAISYALYGQALTNIKRDNLINNINGKHMLVTLFFEKDNTRYQIQRGRKPSVLKFFVNDQEQELTEDEAQGDSRDTQQDLTKLIGMSHDMFKHLVAMNTYSEPFLSMRAADQRLIIEQLLGITQLSEKSTILKDQIKATKDTIFEETTIIESIKKSNETIQQSINALTSKKLKWNRTHEDQIEKLTTAIQQLEEIDIEHELQKHYDLQEYQSLFDLKIRNDKELQDVSNEIIRTEHIIEKISSDILIIKEHTCHSCGQSLHDDKSLEMLKDMEQRLNTETVKKANLLIKHQDIKTIELPEKPNTFYKKYEEALRHQSNLEALKLQLLDKQQETNPFSDQIAELKSTAIQSIDWSTVNELEKIKSHQEFLLKLLTNKDSFIRKKIINQNLIYLNNRLTYYLEKTNLPHIVLFRNDLSVEISQLGKELNFDNLSRGERTRLIISLNLAFRDLWENLQTTINSLFIDELLDVGLDSSGVEHVLGILKKISRDRKKNIFLISHKDELISRVNTVMKVVKLNGFTSIEQ